jgi:hypothetical protein
MDAVSTRVKSEYEGMTISCRVTKPPLLGNGALEVVLRERGPSGGLPAPGAGVFCSGSAEARRESEIL